MQNQKITIDVIESKEFHIASRGYNQHEVDEFLDSICDELESLEAEMAALKRENEQKKAMPQGYNAVPVAPAASADGTFREILEMAQRVKEQTIADAEAKAAEIVANAENEVKARLGSLNAQKAELEAEVEEMRAAAQAYKAKFEELLVFAREALDAACEL